MISKWFHLKDKSIFLRKKGFSITYIENKLGIPRSTLSGWFKIVNLTENQKEKLNTNKLKGLIKARKNAIFWHNKEKKKRIKLIHLEVDKMLSSLIFDEKLLEISLAFLYLGEGFKSNKLGIGNSDPLILKFFINSIKNLYKLDINKFRFYLHLRADQDEKQVKEYWSKQLKVSINRFGKTSFDKRTRGKKTYKYYKGVCVIECGNVAIQRKLLYISKKFCNIIGNKHA